jgi:ABC-2 type transport system ATP-binding protein
MQQKSIMIEISNLTKKLGKQHVINDLSLVAQGQECIGLFGHGGAGKTTLLKLMAGLLKPCSGHVSILGFNTRTHRLQVAQAIGYQPEPGINRSTMSVAGFLNLIATFRRFCGAEKRKRLDRIIMQLELSALLKEPLNALPMGLQRKVALAQAILHDPGVLLLDEPTEGLSPYQQCKIRTLIQTLAEEMTVIVATRDCDALSGICTRALVIGGGRLLADTPMSELQRSSRYYRAVTLAADTPLDLLALAVLPGVAGIEEDRHSPGTVTVLAMPGHAIYPPISALIAKRGWQITALNLEPGRLNDVVHHLSQGASL